MHFYFSLWRILWSYWRLRWSCLWRGFWSLCSDRNRVNWWCCDVGSVSKSMTRVQRWLTHWNILAPKVLTFSPNFKISFIAIFLFWPRPAHSNHCGLSKKTTQSRPMGPIYRRSDSVSGVAEGVEFIRCIDGWEPQIHEIWCPGSNGVTREVHPIAQIDVGTETIGQSLTY